MSVITVSKIYFKDRSIQRSNFLVKVTMDTFLVFN